jgi:hypothetical protein
VRRKTSPLSWIEGLGPHGTNCYKGGSPKRWFCIRLIHWIHEVVQWITLRIHWIRRMPNVFFGAPLTRPSGPPRSPPHKEVTMTKSQCFLVAITALNCAFAMLSIL